MQNLGGSQPGGSAGRNHGHEVRERERDRYEDDECYHGRRAALLERHAVGDPSPRQPADRDTDRNSCEQSDDTDDRALRGEHPPRLPPREPERAQNREVAFACAGRDEQDVGQGSECERGEESRVPHFRGIRDKNGRIMAVMTHNSDVADSWEREGEDPDFFYQFSPDGYALGINVLLYAMSH